MRNNALAETVTMDSMSPGEVGGIFSGIVALIIAIGQGTKWLINWRGAREKTEAARLRAWEKSLDQRERDHAAYIERQLHAMEQKFTRMEHKVSRLASALFETIAELQVLDPASSALAKAKLVLRGAFPPDHDTPDDIKSMVRRLDQDERDVTND